ncbi:MAG TPA: archaeosortase/exosortase family protein [Nitrososphaerales archaeon]|nr:archaeosortase/exosortase family protein [Nitrososphaerales archaeon]
MPKKLGRSHYFVLAIATTFLIPIVIPNMSVDWPFLFTIGLVLFAWFSIKWRSVTELTMKSHLWEMAVGALIIGGDYLENSITHSFLGLIDMLVIFMALVIAFYGLPSLKIFWIPAAYIAILLVGYQIEYNIPSTVVLQDWMAGLMASSMQILGVSATVSGGHYVLLNSGSTALDLNVEGPCTGLQGVLAFGMLSSMTVLDVRAKLSRLLPIFIVGFAGAFLINIVRLFGVFLTFEYLGIDAGTTMHVYLGYSLFIAWVLVFWALAFRYLSVSPPSTTGQATVPPGFEKKFP